jgi:hypothetical protein
VVGDKLTAKSTIYDLATVAKEAGLINDVIDACAPLAMPTPGQNNIVGIGALILEAALRVVCDDGSPRCLVNPGQDVQAILAACQECSTVCTLAWGRLNSANLCAAAAVLPGE